MNFFQLILKQMRQRALSTWLTLLSVVLGVGLGIGIMVLERGAGALFGQTEYGYDVIIGAKGSPMQLVLNSIYQLDQSPGNIPYTLYEQLMGDRRYQANIRIAVPTAVGDTYQGQRIVATMPKFFGFDDAGNPLPPEKTLEYRPDKRYELAFGRVFAPNKFEAVIGSDVPQLTGLNVGGKFKATHGNPNPGVTPDEHEEQWTVVGILKPTHTAADRVLYIPLVSFYTIAEHERGLTEIAQLRSGTTAPAHEEEHAHEEHYTLNPDGTIDLHIPKDEWMLSAVFIRARGGIQAERLRWDINNQDAATAVNPAQVMSQFLHTFLYPSSQLLTVISCLVIVVAGVGILVSIYNSVSARMREIAILRALGATRARILALICVEAGLIGLAGSIIGLICGHLLGAIGSSYVEKLVGEGFPWLVISANEVKYLLAVVALSTAAGLIPALKAYRTPVATNLVTG